MAAKIQTNISLSMEDGENIIGKMSNLSGTASRTKLGEGREEWSK